MRGAGRAPPLSPSPAWGLGEQPPAHPWAGDVHLYEVLLLHHPRYPGAPRFPHSHSSPALGRGTLSSSAPSPTADSPMHNFFLLGGHPRPSQGSPGAPAALLGGASSPWGQLEGDTARGGSSMPSAAFAPLSLGILVAAGGVSSPAPQLTPLPSPAFFPLRYRNKKSQAGCSSELIFKMQNHGRVFRPPPPPPTPCLAVKRYKQNKLPSLAGLRESLSPDLNFKSWLGCSTEHR